MKLDTTNVVVNLNVGNLADALRFYCRFFGARPTVVKPDHVRFAISGTNLEFCFLNNPTKVRENFGHFSLRVSTLSDLEEKIEYARLNHFEVTEAAMNTPSSIGRKRYWIKDPNNFNWEIVWDESDTMNVASPPSHPISPENKKLSA